MSELRHALRAAQATLQKAITAKANAIEAVQRAEARKQELRASLDEARAAEAQEAKQRAVSIAGGGLCAIVDLDAYERRIAAEQRLEVWKETTAILARTVEGAATAERKARDDIDVAVAAVIAGEASPMLVTLRELEQEAARLRTALKAFERLEFHIAKDGFKRVSGLSAYLTEEPPNSNAIIARSLNFEDHVRRWRDLRDRLYGDASAAL